MQLQDAERNGRAGHAKGGTKSLGKSEGVAEAENAFTRAHEEKELSKFKTIRGEGVIHGENIEEKGAEMHNAAGLCPIQTRERVVGRCASAGCRDG